jgi:hypothetical protein
VEFLSRNSYRPSKKMGMCPPSMCYEVMYLKCTLGFSSNERKSSMVPGLSNIYLRYKSIRGINFQLSKGGKGGGTC